jgi:radical SAM superfamily enzyme YgiQ (UPF0313 family)
MKEEEVDELPFEEHWDVVGISAMTASVQRGYEVAKAFKEKGAKIIFGGIHASVLPDETAQFADAVVVGEAEGIWGEVLTDIQENRLKKIYRSTRPDLSGLPYPLRIKRRSLFGLPPVVLPIMASRGCPHDCEFCCVNNVFGLKQRHIPVDDIIEDIKRSGAKKLMFLDDNIWGNRSYAASLFEKLKPLGVKWIGQASVRSILEDKLFDAAVESGLKGLFVGVESVEPKVLKTIKKSLASIDLYEEAIRRCRNAGVSFHASLIFGLDEQTSDVFDITLDFLIRNSVPSISPNVLTPYPGTRLHERLKQEGRILHTNWAYYDHQMVSFKPKHMQPEELAEKYLDFRQRFFSYSSIIRRGFAQWKVTPIIYLATNFSYRSTTRDYKVRMQKYFEWLRNAEKAGTLDKIEAPDPSSVKTEEPQRASRQAM